MRSENKAVVEENEELLGRFDSLNLKIGDLAAMAIDFNVTPRASELNFSSGGSLQSTYRPVFRRENMNELMAVQNLVATQNNDLMSQRAVLIKEMNTLRTEIERLNEFIIKEGNVSEENREILVQNLNKLIHLKFAEFENKHTQVSTSNFSDQTTQSIAHEEELKKEIASLKEISESREKMLKDARDQLEKEQKENIKIKTSYKDEIQRLEDKVKSLTNENSKIREELEEINKSSSGLKASSLYGSFIEGERSPGRIRPIISNVQAIRLKEEVKDKDDRISELNEELNEKKTLNTRYKSENDNLKFELDTKNQEIDRLTKKVQTIELKSSREIQSIKDQNYVISSEIENFARAEREARQQLIIANGDIDILLQENELLKSQLEDSKSQVESWRGKYKKADEEVSLKLERIQILEKKVGQLQSEIADSNTESETAAFGRIKSRYEEEISTAQQENESLRKKLKDKQQEIVDLSIEIEKANMYRPSVEDGHQDSTTAAMKELKTQLRHALDECADYKLLVGQKDRLIEELQRERPSGVENPLAVEGENEEVSRLRGLVESMREELVSKNEESIGLLRKLKEMEKEVDDLTFKVVQNATKHAKEVREKQEEVEEIKGLLERVRKERKKGSELDASFEEEETARAKATVSGLEEANEKLEEELSKMRRFTKQKDQQIGELLDKIEQQADAERRGMQAREREVREEAAQAEGRLTRMVEELTVERDAAKARLGSEAEAASGREARLKARLETVSEELRKSHEVVEELRREASVARRELDIAQSTTQGMGALEKRITDLMGEREKLEKEIHDRRKQERDEEEASQKCLDLQMEVETLESQKARLKEDLGATRRELEEMSVRLLGEKRAKGDLEVKCEVMERRIGEIQKERDEALGKLTIEIETEEKNKELEGQVGQLGKSIERLRDEVARLELDNEGLTRKNRERLDEVHKLELSVENSKNIIRRLEEGQTEDVQRREKERDLVVKVSQLTDECEKLKGKLEEKEDQLEEVKRGNSRIKGEVEDLEKRLRDKTEEVEKLKNSIGDSGIHIIKMELSGLQTTNKELNERLREKSSLLNTALDDKDRLNEQVRSLKRKNEDLEDQLSSLQDNLKEKRLVIEEIKENLSEKGIQDTRLSSKIKDLKSDLESEKMNVKKLEDEIVASKMRLSEISNSQHDRKRFDDNIRSPGLHQDSTGLLHTATHDSSVLEAIERELRRKVEESQKYRSELRVIEEKYEDILNETRRLKSENETMGTVLSLLGLGETYLSAGLSRHDILMKITQYSDLWTRVQRLERDLSKRPSSLDSSRHREEEREETVRRLRDMQWDQDAMQTVMLELQGRIEELSRDNERLRAMADERGQQRTGKRDDSSVIESRVTEAGAVSGEELERLGREVKKTRKANTLYEQRIRELELENEELHDNLDKNVELMNEKYKRMKDRLVEQDAASRGGESVEGLRKRVEELAALVEELKATNKILEEARRADLGRMKEIRRREEALKEAEQRMHGTRQRLLEKEKVLQVREEGLEQMEAMRKEALAGLEEEIQKARGEIDVQIAGLLDKNLVGGIISSEREGSQLGKYLKTSLKGLRNPAKIIDEFG